MATASRKCGRIPRHRPISSLAAALHPGTARIYGAYGAWSRDEKYMAFLSILLEVRKALLLM